MTYLETYSKANLMKRAEECMQWQQVLGSAMSSSGLH